jgi:Ni,Fe-hydrogenase I cytochrome b subunit
VLRIKITFLRKEFMSYVRDILFYDDVTKDIRAYLLISSIESASLVTDPWGPSKSHTYWQTKKIEKSRRNQYSTSYS